MDDTIRFGRAQGLLRKEDQRFLTGTGAYTDDVALERPLHVAIVRSPHAHAKILGIDKSAALAVPGVVGVVTGAELVASGVKPMPIVPGFTREDGSPAASPARYPLTLEIARHVGDPVAAVLAETPEQARDAAELVGVDYEPLPAVVTLPEALERGAPLLEPALGDNVGAYVEWGERSKVDAAFAAAEHVAKVDLVNNRLIPNAIEPRVCIGSFDRASGRYTVRLSCQNNQMARGGIAASLGVAPETIRVVVSDIGGGFGMKTYVYPEDVLVAWLAKHTGRTVKWRADRSESFVADTHGRDQWVRAELALDAQGRFTAMRINLAGNLGAYCAMIGMVVPLRIGMRVVNGVYDVPLIHFRARAVYTNTTPTSAYRGAGRPEAIYVMERLVTEAARVSGIETVELRRRNFIPPSKMPYAIPAGDLAYDCGNFADVMDEALALADWKGFEARKTASAQRGRLRGRGLSNYIEWTGAEMKERVVVEVHGSGRVTLLSGTQNMGQGLESSYAQLVSQVLEIPYESVDVVQGDTDRILGLGSVGSRSLFVGGSAAYKGAQETVETGRRLASDALEANPADIEYKAGRYAIAGTDRAIGLFELAGRQAGGLFTAEADVALTMPSWPNGCCVIEVEIDPETGEVFVDRVTTVDDVGKRINPMIVQGQVHGGLAQGIAQALLEGAIYDPDSGQLLTGTFQDYAIPHADELPAFGTGAYEKLPATGNPLGAKGVGEIGAVSAPPATVAAVLDALKEYGVTHLDMPITREKVWRAIDGAAKNG